MKKILGLDLGVGSIGWSLIETTDDNKPSKILGLGSRIVPLSTDDSNEFTSGNAISKNQKRTQKRTQRKSYDRYQLRRRLLTEKLRELGMLPGEKLIKLPVLELWQLRADAATPGKKLTLPEIGRVLYHINQKRGYRHARTDNSDEKNQRDYVQAINQRYAEITQAGNTIGQHFAVRLSDSAIVSPKGIFFTYRIKEQVFPRAAYMEEFDRIMDIQSSFYPEVLTSDNINVLRNEIIFFQRPLKSCKHLVGKCEFSQHTYSTPDGREIISGPKVAPRSSPLFQVCKLWESINNLTLRNREGDEYLFTKEDRNNIFDFLDSHPVMKVTDLYKILGISKKDGWWGGKAIGKGLQGNTTKVALAEAIKSRTDLLRFNLTETDSNHIDTETGEILRVVSPAFEKEPLYRLWHIVYSMNEKAEMAAALKRNFDIDDEETINSLYSIDFVKAGYGNKSSRFIREILPYLQKGMKYSEACDYIGINHSNSLSAAENAKRQLLDRLPQLGKNDLRQPVIEKILNQMINVVNALLEKYGEFDEIRVELARELKQSKDERNATFKHNNQRERENKEINERILEYGVSPSRSRIQKYRLWQEADHLCFYCGKPVSAAEFLSGYGVEIEHIIPRSLLFDDSYSNKVCACRACNAEKGNKTAFDYMKGKPEGEFQAYLKRVEDAFVKGQISKTKRDRLMTPLSEIPQDFIDRQLRQSQYISKKAVELLKQICRNVWVTGGSVTDFLRHNWGYDQILHDLNFSRYKESGQTEIEEYEHNGQTHKREKIIGWTKRLDHRHHAIDAITIACTRQSYIQRLNALNSSRDAMFEEISAQKPEWQEKFSLLEQWTKLQPHFSVADVKDAADGILVSFKAGKKVSTPGKRFTYKNGKKVLAQSDLIIPRGALSEESVYGRISVLEEKVPVKELFDSPDLILKQYIRDLINERIQLHGGDKKKAALSIKKNPIWIDEEKHVPLEYASRWKKEYVIRYPLSSIKAKDVSSIVDGRIREIIKQRIDEVGEKNAFKEPLFIDQEHKIPIRSVRLFTGLSNVAPVKYSEGKPVGFVKPGNNHHIAIYKDSEGNLIEHVVSFWHAVERKKYGIPIIIKDTTQMWDDLFGKELPGDFLHNLPAPGLSLEYSLQQNEMFILGMPEEEFNDAIQSNDKKKLNKYLYRVQKIATKNYFFRYHIETLLDDSKEAAQMLKYYSVRSFDGLMRLNPHKVAIGVTGELSLNND